MVIDEKEYWKNSGFKTIKKDDKDSISEDHNIRTVQYGADQSVSYFDSTVTEFNISSIESELKYKVLNVSGISKSYSYFGKAGSSFAWHIEDQAFFSISYLHAGSPKVWYVLPPAEGPQFETLFKGI